MKKGGSNTRKTRELLRRSDDGLTVEEIAQALGDIPHSYLSKILRNMPDAYIDRWQLSKAGRHRAVWAVVVPPENCPRPARKKDRMMEIY